MQRAYEAGTQLEIGSARTIHDVEELLDSGVDRILLDNMSVEMMREAVKLNAGRAKLEASGNVTLETVRAIAETGVDYISVGATHSPRVFDVSLKWKTVGQFNQLIAQSRMNIETPPSGWQLKGLLADTVPDSNCVSKLNRRRD